MSGYIVGAPDTREFETRLEAEWWPTLRRLYPDPFAAPRVDWSRDQLISYKIHHPDRTADEIVEPYPSHLHINLLPHLRGAGIGRRLMERWLATVREMGSHGAHLAVGAANRAGHPILPRLRLLRARTSAETDCEAIWFAIDLRSGVDGSCTRRAAG